MFSRALNLTRARISRNTAQINLSSITHNSINNKCLAFSKINNSTGTRCFSTEKEDQQSDLEEDVVQEVPVVIQLEDAILVRQEIIDQIRNPAVNSTLKAIGSSNDCIYVRWHNVQKCLLNITSHVITELREQEKISLPDMGEDHTLAHNFQTISHMIAQGEDGQPLFELLEEQWSVLLDVIFGVDPALTDSAKISPDGAWRIANMYNEFTKTPEFKAMMENALVGCEVAADDHYINVKMAKYLEHRARERRLSEVLDPFLKNLYGKFDYEGDEGFVLMQKALSAHSENFEVVNLLNEAASRAMAIAGISQSLE